ncbi:hypothetical protein like AT2G27180 [Hibiscus trionum]|uniref:Uncharacterized protein n=1 Tax=Hibiscus trionum TaxID=183268 RepID=A0A9W7ILJ8_HIBTR|nr:hypothetical protein like AT2G27180 [Hibiscus trionum]
MTLKQLPRSPPKTARKGRNYGGMVGGSAAECTAVACCVPLTVMDMLFLGLYKVPAGLCKKACTRKKRHHDNHGFHPTPPPMEDLHIELDRMMKGNQSGDTDNEDDGFREERLLSRFPGTGFWREPSEIDDSYDVTAARD